MSRTTRGAVTRQPRPSDLALLAACAAYGHARRPADQLAKADIRALAD